MKIRSVTLFENPGDPIQEEVLNLSESFSGKAKNLFQSAGYAVQTIRLATPPFPAYLRDITTNRVLSYAEKLEQSYKSLSFDYISLGPALPSSPESYSIIPDLIRATNDTFCSGLMTDTKNGVSLRAVRSCGKIIHQLAPLDQDGFANLYFAALGNVPPGAPFFPAAYSGDENPIFAIAVEAADLAVEAFSEAPTFAEARDQLISSIEQHGKELTRVSQDLEKSTGISFGGIDYSLAPFPTDKLSIGTALEELGLKQLGYYGSLAAAAFLADVIDRADFPRTGFSGLMLPLLEDAILAKRAAEGSLGLKDLLLYSTVCGTGLDTIPLPGDISADQLSAILFDLAALSMRLNKPLTARLMPIPGKSAGDPTTFDFPFFANSKVLDVGVESLSGLFLADGWLDIKPRG
jgi:uncharacterized protein (UPF0210 family)